MGSSGPPRIPAAPAGPPPADSCSPVMYVCQRVCVPMCACPGTARRYSRVPTPRPVWHLCCPARCSHTSPSSPLPLTTAAGSSCPPPARPRRSERAHTALVVLGPSALVCLLREAAALQVQNISLEAERWPARLRRRPCPPAAHRAACSLLPAPSPGKQSCRFHLRFSDGPGAWTDLPPANCRPSRRCPSGRWGFLVRWR